MDHPTPDANLITPDTITSPENIKTRRKLMNMALLALAPFLLAKLAHDNGSPRKGLETDRLNTPRPGQVSGDETLQKPELAASAALSMSVRDNEGFSFGILNMFGDETLGRFFPAVDIHNVEEWDKIDADHLNLSCAPLYDLQIWINGKDTLESIKAKLDEQKGISTYCTVTEAGPNQLHYGVTYVDQNGETHMEEMLTISIGSNGELMFSIGQTEIFAVVTMDGVFVKKTFLSYQHGPDGAMG